MSAPGRAGARIERARARIGELLNEIASWPIAENGAPELRVAADRRSFELFFRLTNEPPTDRWGLLLGEILHHLRAGLDNVVYAHAVANSDGPVSSPRALHFPICLDERIYGRTAENALGPGFAVLEPIVRAFQPFGVGQGDAFLQPGDALLGQHPLALLAELNNTDKHRDWTVLVPSLDQINLGSADVPFAIEFDDLTEVEEPIRRLTLLDAELAKQEPFLRAEFAAPIKRIEAAGGLNIGIGVPTSAGPIRPEALLHGLLLVCGLIMLRIEDPTSSIDVIYERLHPLLSSAAAND